MFDCWLSCCAVKPAGCFVQSVCTASSTRTAQTIACADLKVTGGLVQQALVACRQQLMSVVTHQAIASSPSQPMSVGCSVCASFMYASITQPVSSNRAECSLLQHLQEICLSLCCTSGTGTCYVSRPQQCGSSNLTLTYSGAVVTVTPCPAQLQ